MAGVVLVAASSFPRGLGSDNSSWPLTSRQHLLIQHMPKTGGTSFRKMVFRDAARLGKTWCRTPVTSCFLHRQPMPRWRRPQGRCTYWRGFRRRAPRRGEEGAWASLWAEVEDVAGADGSWICSEVPARGFLLFERSEPIQPSASPGRDTRSATAGWSATAGSWGDNRVKVNCKWR